MAEAQVSIKGENGSWEIRIAHNDADKARDTIRIEFTPKQPNRCKGLIGLIQAGKLVGFDKDGKRITDPNQIYIDPKSDPDHGKIGLEPEKDVKGEPVTIDYRRCSKHPYYGTAGEANEEPLIPQPAKMSDTPGGPMEALKPEIRKVEMTFETCAVCVATGACLGCFTWSMEQSRENQPEKGAVTKIKVTSKEEQKDCSGPFKGALRKYAKTHTGKDAANGKLKWKCPEGEEIAKEDDLVEKVIGKFGKPIPPEVPKEFEKNVLEEVEPKVKSFRYSRSEVGGGLHFERVRPALAAALENPANSLVKLTWSGYQVGVRPSVVFTAYPQVSWDDVAPYIDFDDRFSNDFVQVLFIRTTEDFLRGLVSSLREYEQQLERTAGTVTVSLVANLRSTAVGGFTGALEPDAVEQLVRAVWDAGADDRDVTDALRYVSLNMGLEEL